MLLSPHPSLLISFLGKMEVAKEHPSGLFGQSVVNLIMQGTKVFEVLFPLVLELFIPQESAVVKDIREYRCYVV